MTPRVSLHLADAEVWAFRIGVSGEVDLAASALRDCAVVVGGGAQPAELQGARFFANVGLSEGRNAVQARCRTASGTELRSQTVHLTVMLRAAPTARARAVLDSSERLLLDGSHSTPDERTRAAIVEYVWYSAGPLGAPAREPIAKGQRTVLPVPSSDGAHVYELRVTDADGRSDTARAQLTVLGGRPEVEPVQGPAPWVGGAVVYGVFPPLFGTPPLRGVTARLDDLAALGVTALWLSPVFDSPEGDYGYAVTDYFSVRDDYGDEGDLAELVQNAHERGLRVLLDLVPNHTSEEHPYFEQASALGRVSHYYDFYDRDARGRVTHYFDWVHLPNLEYDNPEVGRFMTAASSYWIRLFGVDGYRVDAAWGVVQREPSFFPAWAAELRRARPDALLVAEASARDPYYVESGFDLAYDWTEEVGRWAWQDVFSEPKGVARRLHAAIAKSAERTPPERVLRFLNNNDTGARFITRHGEPMTRVATAALLTLPGVPALFSFDEVGAEFEPYAVEGPLRIPDRPALRAFHAQLIALRRSRPALYGEGYLPVHVGEDDELFVFLRARARSEDPIGVALDARNREVALVALNFGARPVSAQVVLPSRLARLQDATFRDALGGGTVRATAGRLPLALPPWAVRIFELR